MAKLVLGSSELPLEDKPTPWSELSDQPISERAILDAVAVWANTLLSVEEPGEFKKARQALGDCLVLLSRFRARQHQYSVRSKPCKSCTALTFWATTPPMDGRGQWIPFETDPLNQPLGMPEAFCWEMDFSAHPPICYNTRPADGQYWVDHRQTCGDRAGPNRPCEPYLQRWRINTQRVGKDARLAIADLLELQKKLAEGEA